MKPGQRTDVRTTRLYLCEDPSVRRAHLIGIGGSGMRSLARVLVGQGWSLTGSDMSVESLSEIADTQISVVAGHSADNVSKGVELVVASDAIRSDNPELLRAAELGIPRASYFEVLGQLMEAKRGVAIAGTHGKSTTTAMAARIMIDAGLDPTVVFGASPVGKIDGGHAGRGEAVLVEACEYRRNFLHLRPKTAVILGIEPDHFDCYKSVAELEDAFAQFAGSVPDDGLLLVRQDCPASQRVTTLASCCVETFGLFPWADWSARDLVECRGVYSFRIFQHDNFFCDVSLRVAGRHNVLNALAAAAVSWHNRAAVEQIVDGLRRFDGLSRRLEVVGTWEGVTFVDDYAHHPTEVVATLSTVRQLMPNRRVLCVFQPHQAVRTAKLLDELATSLQNVDMLLVDQIFRAREPKRRSGEVTAVDLAERARSLGVDVPNVHTPDEIVDLLLNRITAGDVVITIGAGDVRKICVTIIDEVKRMRAVG